MAVDFEEVFADGEEEVPKAGAGEGFGAPGRALDAYDTSDDVLASTRLFARRIAVSH